MANQNDPSETERPREETENVEGRPFRRPFDTSGVNWVPDLKEDDPPYLDWWVVGQEQSDK